jgi:hypothetical protein
VLVVRSFGKITNVLQAHGLPAQEYWDVTSNPIKTTADLVRVVNQQGR